MKFKNPFKHFKSRLTQVGGKEPLHFFSLMMILALDIFVLINIFQGLSFQNAQLERPQEVIPYACTEFFSRGNNEVLINRGIVDKALQHDSYFREVNNKYASGANIIENREKEKVDKRCHEIYEKALVLYNDSTLRGQREEIRVKHQAIYELNTRNGEDERVYDTMLLEQIAGQDDTLSLTDRNAKNVKSTIEANDRKIENLEEEIETLWGHIESTPMAEELVLTIKKHEPGLTKTKKKLAFWYPLKKNVTSYLFLLPLLFFFFWFYRKMSQKDYSLLSLMAAHLFLVTLVPVVFELFRLIMDIVPFHFLSDVLDILEALNLLVLWNYVLIALGILFTFGLIYFLQKKVFSAHKTWEKRLSKNKCWSCGKQKLGISSVYCSHCGESQKETCSHCGELKTCKTEFCEICGKKSG